MQTVKSKHQTCSPGLCRKLVKDPHTHHHRKLIFNFEGVLQRLWCTVTSNRCEPCRKHAHICVHPAAFAEHQYLCPCLLLCLYRVTIRGTACLSRPFINLSMSPLPEQTRNQRDRCFLQSSRMLTEVDRHWKKAAFMCSATGAIVRWGGISTAVLCRVRPQQHCC